jgi:dolichol-phosphate mannosyltransferase
MIVNADSNVLLSIVSPVYQAENTIKELVRRIDQAAAKITDKYEIILVEDRSFDDSWLKIVEVASSNPRVRGARLSRNYGQHAAITAALSLSKGEHVVVIDCDLQHDPGDIQLLYNNAVGGHDIVLARHPNRQHAPSRNIGAAFFCWIMTLFSGEKQLDTNLSGFSILSRKVVDAFLRFNESHRHFLHSVSWMGFSVSYVDILHHERLQGKSSYTIKSLIRHALHGIIGQSTRLLHLSILMGFMYFIASIIGIIYVLARYFFWGLKEGWASGIVLLLASTGSILLSLGIIGLYIGSIYEQVRGRPLFLIDETANFSL